MAADKIIAESDDRIRIDKWRRAGLDSEPALGGRPEKKQRRALQRLRGY